jgi:hypothetical protein
MMFYYPVSRNPYSARIVPSRFMPTLYIFGNTRYAARQLKEKYRGNYAMAQSYLTQILENASDKGTNGYLNDGSFIATKDSVSIKPLGATKTQEQMNTMLSELKKCVAKLNKMDDGMTVTLGDNLPTGYTKGTEAKIEKGEHPYYTVKTKKTDGSEASVKLHILSLRNKLL